MRIDQNGDVVHIRRIESRAPRTSTSRGSATSGIRGRLFRPVCDPRDRPAPHRLPADGDLRLPRPAPQRADPPGRHRTASTCTRALSTSVRSRPRTVATQNELTQPRCSPRQSRPGRSAGPPSVDPVEPRPPGARARHRNGWTPAAAPNRQRPPVRRQGRPRSLPCRLGLLDTRDYRAVDVRLPAGRAIDHGLGPGRRVPRPRAATAVAAACFPRPRRQRGGAPPRLLEGVCDVDLDGLRKGSARERRSPGSPPGPSTARPRRAGPCGRRSTPRRTARTGGGGGRTYGPLDQHRQPGRRNSVIRFPVRATGAT